jgi:hypothetical protein
LPQFELQNGHLPFVWRIVCRLENRCGRHLSPEMLFTVEINLSSRAMWILILLGCCFGEAPLLLHEARQETPGQTSLRSKARTKKDS